EPRTYDAIVRDLLTTLTGGTVRETVTAPPAGATTVLDRLRDRPVRRVSHLEGTVAVGAGPDAPRIGYRFTDADFELVSTAGDPADKDAIRFRDGGRAPVPGTDLTVNYYPVAAPPAPVNDLNVGSVVRTLLETVARELAETYQHLDHVYRSAFLETAEGDSLDNVVALVGVRRLAPGHPVVRVRFERGGGGAAGRVTVPVGTAVTDATGARYLTVAELTLEAGEPSREVLAAGESAATPLVDAGALDRPEVVLAGIDRAFNPEPSRAAAAPETDEELRRRARGALHGVARGTLDALYFGVRSVPGVKDLEIVEAPNGVYGEVAVTVAYEDPSDVTVRQAVRDAIDELRPAGILVTDGGGRTLRVGVRVTLTLAGTGLSGAEEAALKDATTQRLSDLLRALPPGGTVRRAQLAALVLQDERIVDATVELRPEGREPTETLQLASGEVLELGAVEYGPVAAERAAAPGATTSTVSAVLPVHLLPGVTAAEATTAIDAAFDAHLAARAPGAALTVDGIAAAIRDDTRYVLVRGDAQATVEAGERFLQLTDGVGAYEPAAAETLQRGTVTVDVREGGV
ncbi:MAG TPA: hypothetical protein VLB47_08365, partial [Solirubrobacteraceae bacterium]|nr:hypothetical protein [Solirubrobacteraceae bacterium]